MAFVRPYEPGDDLYISTRLRRADLHELQAQSERTPAAILREGGMISLPSCTVVGNSGQPAGMFGVVPEGSGVGRIWMLGTDELVAKPMRTQFIRESKNYLSGLEHHFKIYKLLHNEIDERNTIHIRWLQWLGFTFIRRIPEHGIHRLPFMEFVKLCAWPANKPVDRPRQVEQP